MMAASMGARRRLRGGGPRARFAASERADGQWEVVDRQTGTAPVDDKVMPVRQAAAGYAAWLNREDRDGLLGPDYRSARPRRDLHHPEEATGGEIGRIWAWRSGRRGAVRGT